jgi:FixJ family two-component response regulator
MEEKHLVEPLRRHDRSEGGETSTVFVVNDDRAIREVMRDMLQEKGYAVELFGNGAAFLEAYRPGRKGCLLVDALMPGMSGIELIEHLKAEGDELPAIVITGNAAVPMAVQAMKAGAMDFIEKPVDYEGLLARVKASTRSYAGHRNAVCTAGDGRAARCRPDDTRAANPRSCSSRPSKQEDRR